MKSYKIAPSILSANLACLGQEAQRVIEAGADWIHFDVMDNHYVPNLTFGPDICSALRAYGVTAPIDVHLMVQPVDALIKRFARAGATYLTFHLEASSNVSKTIELILQEGCRPGVALKPEISCLSLQPILNYVDLILLMTVSPGFGGQSFIPSMLEKIRLTRKLIDENERKPMLAVDGGISLDNIKSVAMAGAEVFVAGTAIFKTPHYANTIHALKKKIEG